jgi:predicted anti-sigma-YlaC factor YlaD
MTCPDVLDHLDDYVDGLLAESEAGTVREHLASCEPCRREEALLRQILAEASSLPRERALERDLWPGIAAAIRPAEIRPFVARPRTIRFLLPALAAAAVVVAAISVFLSGSPTGPAGGLLGTPIPVSTGRGHVDLLDAEAGYARATDELMAALAKRGDSLSPETRQTVERNLAVIDQALKEIRDALQKEPDNPELNRMLTATHRKKVDVLRRVVRLSQATL